MCWEAYFQGSADGRFDRTAPDLALFCGIVASFAEDATLAGSNTIVAGYPDQTAWLELDAHHEPPPRKADGSLPLLVVPDSRGRIRVWHLLLQEQYWRDAARETRR